MDVAEKRNNFFEKVKMENTELVTNKFWDFQQSWTLPL